MQTEQELRDSIVTALGGRCAEQHFFGRITTGAEDDLRKAYSLSHQMITKLGMNRNIGYVNYEENQYGHKQYSDHYNDLIDLEIKSLIEECTTKCQKLIKKHEKQLGNLAELLLRKGNLGLEDITATLGKRPFEPKQNLKEFLGGFQAGLPHPDYDAPQLSPGPSNSKS